MELHKYKLSDQKEKLQNYLNEKISPKINGVLNIIHYINPKITFSFFKYIVGRLHFIEIIDIFEKDKVKNYGNYFINEIVSFIPNKSYNTFQNIDSFVFINSIIQLESYSRDCFKNSLKENISVLVLNLKGLLNNVIIRNNKFGVNYKNTKFVFSYKSISYINEDFSCFLSYQQLEIDKKRSLNVLLSNGKKIQRNKNKNYTNFISSKNNKLCQIYDNKIEKIISNIPHEIISSNGFSF